MDVPELAIAGVYSNKSMFQANERFDQNWLHSIVGINDIFPNGNNTQITARGSGYSTSFISYGIAYEFPIKIYNGGGDREFIYRLQGQLYQISIRAYDEAGNEIYSYGSKSDENSSNGVDHDYGGIILKSGECTTIKIRVTLPTGSTGVMKHKFIIQ